MFRAVQRRVRTAIGQEPYLGFNAMGDVYLAGTEAPKLPPAITEAAQEWERVDKTSSVELETFVRRHGSSPEADYARARIAALTKQVVSSAPKAKQPAPMGGMSRCESLSERAVCEFDPIFGSTTRSNAKENLAALQPPCLKARLPPCPNQMSLVLRR
jgi:hypothetical protein